MSRPLERYVLVLGMAVLALGVSPLGASREASAASFLDLVSVSGSAGFDATSGNFIELTQVYRNTSASDFLLLDELSIVMLNPEDLGFADLTVTPDNSAAVVAAGESAFLGFIFSFARNTADLSPVSWMTGTASIAGIDYVLTPPTVGDPTPTLDLASQLILAPGGNFAVTFKLHNDEFGGATAAEIGELVMGVHFTPEPSTALLLGTGMLGLVAARRRLDGV